MDDSAQSTENENVPGFSGIIDFGSDSLPPPALSTGKVFFLPEMRK